MAHVLRSAIDEINKVIEAKLKEIAELKRSVNALCHEAGLEPLYQDTDAGKEGGRVVLRPDSYYGKPLATAVRDYLLAQGHAVLLQEILQALEQGGFDFDSVQWGPENRLRNLAISVSKNPAFKRLPSGVIGLKPWYQDKPDRPAKKRPAKAKKTQKAKKGEAAPKKAQKAAKAPKAPAAKRPATHTGAVAEGGSP